MTDADLRTLYLRRNAVLQSMSGSINHRPKTLGQMTAEERAEADEASRIFNAADRAIVQELKRRGRPVVLGKVELRLTADMLHYAPCNPATHLPLDFDGHGKGLLFDYGDAERVKRMTDASKPRPVSDLAARPVIRTPRVPLVN